MSIRILALVGSLRAGSYNRQLAEAAVKYAPEGTDVQVFDGLAEVPFYNEDLDVPGSVPAPAQALRGAVARADALLLITPEYNGTIPAALPTTTDFSSDVARLKQLVQTVLGLTLPSIVDLLGLPRWIPRMGSKIKKDA